MLAFRGKANFPVFYNITGVNQLPVCNRLELIHVQDYIGFLTWIQLLPAKGLIIHADSLFNSGGLMYSVEQLKEIVKRGHVAVIRGQIRLCEARQWLYSECLRPHDTHKSSGTLPVDRKSGVSVPEA